MIREVDRWLGTDEWKLALRLHSILCKSGHQMDQCWGLVLPYDMRQPAMSDIQLTYLSKSQRLINLVGVNQANRICDIL
jgi:hypothetical protein